jgi:hypothetical protein
VAKIADARAIRSDPVVASCAYLCTFPATRDRLMWRETPGIVRLDAQRKPEKADMAAIRGALPSKIVAVYKADDAIPNLIPQDDFRDAVLRAEDPWRRVVVLAVKLGMAIPAFCVPAQLL